MRRILEKKNIDQFRAEKKNDLMCLNCGSSGKLVYGGIFKYKNTTSEGSKYKCSSCGAVGIDWFVLEWVERELCDKATLNWETDEINVAQDELF